MSRARPLAISAVIAAAAVGSAALVNVLAERFPFRLDGTSAGTLRPGPRTERILAALNDPVSIVVAAPRTTTGPREWERVSDTLAALSNASPLVRTSLIDTASPEGERAFRALEEDLRAQDAPALAALARAIDEGAGVAGAAARTISAELEPRLIARRDAAPAGSPEREQWNDRAAGLRVLASELQAAVSPGASIGPDQFAARRESLRAVLANAAGQADALAAKMPDPGAFRGLRDMCARAADALEQAPTPATTRIARALRSPPTALVIGPPGRGLTAVDPSALLAPADPDGPDPRRRAEELFATAVLALGDTPRPVVVLMHGEPGPFLARVAVFRRLEERLSARGIDLIEWAAAASPEPPPGAVGRADGRPVVFAVFSPAAWAGGGTEGQAPGAQRAEALAKAVRERMDAGDPILLSLNPSPMPGVGTPDPIAALLSPFGLEADSGRPLLRERFASGGRTVETDFTVLPRSVGPEAPALAAAIAGLPTFVPWPIDIGPIAGSQPDWIPLAVIAQEESVWRESRWLRLMQIPREQRPLAPDLPSFDADRDARLGAIVAAAARRTTPEGVRQRLVVVGSNSWFVDQVTGQTGEADGRAALVYPGNLELFDAAVHWLADQEDLIARGSEAAAVPVVRDLSPATITGLRVALIAGVPALILGAGVLFRWWRG